VDIPPIHFPPAAGQTNPTGCKGHVGTRRRFCRVAGRTLNDLLLARLGRRGRREDARNLLRATSGRAIPAAWACQARCESRPDLVKAIRAASSAASAIRDMGPRPLRRCLWVVLQLMTKSTHGCRVCSHIDRVGPKTIAGPRTRSKTCPSRGRRRRRPSCYARRPSCGRLVACVTIRVGRRTVAADTMLAFSGC
jgi:hypothetical protein